MFTQVCRNYFLIGGGQNHEDHILRRPPEIQLGCLGSAVSFPSGVWGRAPAEIEFGVF